jgi:virginiamycin B lyase
MTTHEYTSWDIPKENGQLPHSADLDRFGNLWITTIGGENSGVVKLDIKSGEQTRFAVPTKFAGTYSIQLDKNDNAWFTEITANKISKIDRSGKLTEYDAPKPHSLPRRMQLDSKGKVWFTESGYAKIAMLDPETTKITEYDYGTWVGFPYLIKVDKFDRVWFDDIQGNSMGMYDQATKKFVVVPLPTPESFARDASFDYTTDPPSIVYSSADLPIIGRMYIRKAK